MIPRILVVDDEPRMGRIVAMVLEREGWSVQVCTRARDALAALQDAPADVLVTDLRMPDLDGLALLREARALDGELPVILMTAHGSVPSAVAAMRDGAFDYVLKPFENDELTALVRRALDVSRLSRENRYLRAAAVDRPPPDRMVAGSDVMRGLLDQIRLVARSRSTVLLTGESGTGKELVARAIHYYSPRVDRPFVACNCRALAEGVLESELFGHERGAFTGAVQARPGLFERADGGTLFLDEVGEVGESFQAKLLRVLQEREVQRVGGGAVRPVDVRVVAATNRDLAAAVASGAFREDLYFRLAVIPIALPPLRDRPADIMPLAHHFLARWNAELGRGLTGFSDAAARALQQHGWPGNVRELENAVERAAVLAGGPQVEAADLALRPAAASPTDPPVTDALDARLDQVAADHIARVLREANGVRGEAARRLGVERTTLYRLMKKYGLLEG